MQHSARCVNCRCSCRVLKCMLKKRVLWVSYARSDKLVHVCWCSLSCGIKEMWRLLHCFIPPLFSIVCLCCYRTSLCSPERFVVLSVHSRTVRFCALSKDTRTRRVTWRRKPHSRSCIFFVLLANNRYFSLNTRYLSCFPWPIPDLHRLHDNLNRT